MIKYINFKYITLIPSKFLIKICHWIYKLSLILKF